MKMGHNQRKINQQPSYRLDAAFITCDIFRPQLSDYDLTFYRSGRAPPTFRKAIDKARIENNAFAFVVRS